MKAASAFNLTDNTDAQESRGGMQLRAYWNKLRGRRPYPAESEIDPDELAAIWDSCFLISMDNVTKRSGYCYSYLGKRIIEAYGEDMYNPGVISNLISGGHEHNERLIDCFDKVVSTQKPVTDESEFVNMNRLTICYRVSLFPVGRDGKITHILGLMRWRVY